jgi:hypothetical protein
VVEVGDATHDEEGHCTEARDVSISRGKKRKKEKKDER